MKLGLSLLVVGLVAAGSFVACTATVNSGPGTVVTNSGTKADSSIKADAGTDTGAVAACGPIPTSDAQLVAQVKPAAAPKRGSCTEAEITAVVTTLVDQNTTYQDVSDTMIGACRTCLVTDVKDEAAALALSSWASFVAFSPNADGKNQTAFLENHASTCGAAVGNNDACSTRRAAFDICPDVVCAKCDADADFTQCLSDADGDAKNPGPCQTAVDFTKCDKAAADAFTAGCENADEKTRLTTRLTAACGPIAR